MLFTDSSCTLCTLGDIVRSGNMSDFEIEGSDEETENPTYDFESRWKKQSGTNVRSSVGSLANQSADDDPYNFEYGGSTKLKKVYDFDDLDDDEYVPKATKASAPVPAASAVRSSTQSQVSQSSNAGSVLDKAQEMLRKYAGGTVNTSVARTSTSSFKPKEYNEDDISLDSNSSDEKPAKEQKGRSGATLARSTTSGYISTAQTQVPDAMLLL